MRTLHWSLIAVACTLAIAGCKKKPEADATATTPPAATVPAPQTTAAAPAPTPEPKEQTPEEREAAAKKAKLDYAMMEDGYINDAKAQWANFAKASSSFNDNAELAKQKPETSRAWKATGSPDGSEWTQKSQDIGMDWIELGYAKPVNATEVRAVFINSDAVKAIAKVELIDEGGAAQTVWSGVSDMQPEKRGNRTWFVRQFPKTGAKIKGVKLTFANAVSSGYKEVDAVQLVGEE